jgi:hypothetical protein
MRALTILAQIEVGEREAQSTESRRRKRRRTMRRRPDHLLV